MYGQKKSSQRQGFTIVELLIVIVVVAILAAISVGAYTGIQTRAKNNKTVTAVAAWAKAIKLYEIENGNWPTSSACLGSANTYDGSGRCWSNVSVTVSSSLQSAVGPYMGGGAPEPDATSITHGGQTFRGARYQNTGTIYYVLTNTASCPAVSNINQTYNLTLSGGGVMCGGAIQ